MSRVFDDHHRVRRQHQLPLVVGDTRVGTGHHAHRGVNRDGPTSDAQVAHHPHRAAPYNQPALVVAVDMDPVEATVGEGRNLFA
jgi:hypothetical protein